MCTGSAGCAQRGAPRGAVLPPAPHTAGASERGGAPRVRNIDGCVARQRGPAACVRCLTLCAHGSLPGQLSAACVHRTETQQVSARAHAERRMHAGRSDHVLPAKVMCLGWQPPFGAHLGHLTKSLWDGIAGSQDCMLQGLLNQWSVPLTHTSHKNEPPPCRQRLPQFS